MRGRTHIIALLMLLAVGAVDLHYVSVCPVRADPSVAGLERGDKEGTATIDSFLRVLAANPHSIMIIDVRTPEQFAQAHFPTAVNIPIDTLPMYMDDLPTDKPVLFVCHRGSRSREAYDLVSILLDDVEVYYLNALTVFDSDGNYVIHPE